jgi:Mycothiol maleylpyruvate isomerase N-terminal domain
MVDDVGLKPPAERAHEVVDANEELVAFVESCSDADWASVCEGETWPVGVVAYHVADGHRVVAEWIGQLLAGGVSLTRDELNAANAVMAAQHADVTPAEVIDLSRRNVQMLAVTLRQLSENDLRAAAPFGPAGGMVVPVDDIAGSRGHLDRHLASMRAAAALGR